MVEGICDDEAIRGVVGDCDPFSEACVATAEGPCDVSKVAFGF